MRLVPSLLRPVLEQQLWLSPTWETVLGPSSTLQTALEPLTLSWEV
jgi:hypothetical protein